MKVMPLETAMFLEIYTQMKSHLKEEQQAPVVVKIPVHLVNVDQCFYGMVLSRCEWVGVGGGYEELQSLRLIENYEPCVRRNVR